MHVFLLVGDGFASKRLKRWLKKNELKFQCHRQAALNDYVISKLFYFDC